MAKTEDKKKTASGYGAESIQVLEGLEPVRKRPGMYIGSTGVEGLHHLIWEIFDNSRDEAMNGHCNRIEVALLPGNRVRVVDNGRGIPVDIHKATKVSALEMVMTTLHAGGKFGGEGSGYKVSGGLHGVGASVVNALSSYAKVVVHRDGGEHMQEYARGKKKAHVKRLGASTMRGTIVTFEPDPEIFEEIKWNWKTIIDHLRQQAYLVKGLEINILDLREYAGKIDVDKTFWLRDEGYEAPSQSFYFEGGLFSLVQFYNKFQTPLHKNIFYVDKQEGSVEVEVALQYVDDIVARETAFANNIYNPEGGMHVTGFRTALTRCLNDYLKKNGSGKDAGESFTGEDVREGLTAVVSIKMPEIQFEGQTKAKLGSVEARGATEKVFGEAFAMWLEEHPDDAKAILQKAVLAVKARKAAKAAKDSVLRKGALEGLTLPGKLADCQSRSAEESELFIVEGDSAGGCFSGDTEVALVDGRNLSFKELVDEHEAGKKNYCYTIDKSGDIAVAPILHPRVTKRNSEVMRLTLDSGETIICTPDHRFMLRDGSYREAHALTPDDSLQPLRRQISKLGKRITIKGYELVYTPASHRWIFTHLLGDRYNLAAGLYVKERGDTIHHVDFNKRNNNPDNLTRLGKQEHLMFHTTCLEHTLHSAESKEKSRKVRQSLEYREKIRAIMTKPEMRTMLSARAKKQLEDPRYKKFMMEKFLAFYETNEEYRKENNARLDAAQKAHWSSDENRKAQTRRTARFFAPHPERKVDLRDIANAEWQDPALRTWRAETTREQWTDAFRKKRKESYSRTYLRKALRAFNDIWRTTGAVDVAAYDRVRKETGDRSLIRHDTILSRYFGGDAQKFTDAVVNFNHRIVRAERLSERIDVYDIEVPETHNFALACGVFVHNSSKQGRDRRTQAILPLRGKILNVERARLDKMLSSEQVKNLVIALGTAIGDTFDIAKLRYHKVIIATDADVDGAHIRTLLLTLFYRYFKQLIESGHIYIAQPPLYKVKKGKEQLYFYDDAAKNAFLKKEGIDASAVEEEPAEADLAAEAAAAEEAEEAEEKSAVKKSSKVHIQRYKGLGEMNPEELWETTMDPERRVLKKVDIDDAVEADKIFDLLMGTEVAPRKSFIQSNAKLANLDV